MCGPVCSRICRSVARSSYIKRRLEFLRQPSTPDASFEAWPERLIVELGKEALDLWEKELFEV